MKKTLCLLAMVMMLVVGMTVNESAGMKIDFVILGGGEVNLTDTTITGIDIPVYAVIATGTPLNPGMIIFSDAGPSGYEVFLDFEATLGAAGGSITVSSPAFPTPFLVGTFLDNPYAPMVTPEFMDISIFAAPFVDTKGSAILLTFGIPAEGWAGLINLSFDTSTGIAASGDVINTPIPGSLVLLGSGLMGLVGIGVRRKST
jgi:hypothetical protein